MYYGNGFTCMSCMHVVEIVVGEVRGDYESDSGVRCAFEISQRGLIGQSQCVSLWPLAYTTGRSVLIATTFFELYLHPSINRALAGYTDFDSQPYCPAKQQHRLRATISADVNNGSYADLFHINGKQFFHFAVSSIQAIVRLRSPIYNDWRETTTIQRNFEHTFCGFRHSAA
jgi:hypothetical protein